MESDILLNQNNILNSIGNSNGIETTQQDMIDKNLNSLLKGAEEEDKKEDDTLMHNNEEEKENKEKMKNEKISSVPAMMRCYICEDFCEEGVQIVCCNEIFCEKHIKEEIMKNFLCPNCQKGTNMRNVIRNEKLRTNIAWYKNLLSEPLLPNSQLGNNLMINSNYNTHGRQGGQYSSGVSIQNNLVSITSGNGPTPAIKLNENITKENDIEKEVNNANGSNKGGDLRKIEDTKEMSPEEKMILFDNMKKDDQNANVKVEEIKSSDTYNAQSNNNNKLNPKAIISTGPSTGMFPTSNMIDSSQMIPNNPVLMTNVPLIPNMPALPGMNNLAIQQMMMYRMMQSQMQVDNHTKVTKSKTSKDKSSSSDSSSSSSEPSSRSSYSSDSDDSNSKRKRRSRSKSRSDSHHHRSSRRNRKSSRHDTDKKKKHSTKEKNRNKDKDKNRDKDKDKNRDKDKDRKRDKDKGNERNKEKSKDKDRDKTKDKYKDRNKEKDRKRDKEKTDKSKDSYYNSKSKYK